MKKHLLPKVNRYFKANLHCHTVISDGKCTPQQIKEQYMAQGYQIVAFTDHEICVPHPELCCDDFIAITSYELSVSAPGARGYDKCYHLNIYAKDPANRWQTFHPRYAWGNLKNYADQVVCDGYEEREYSIDFVNRKIAEANEKGFLVCYNHPYWSLQDWSDYAELKGLWGIEVYNTSSALHGFEDDNDSPYRDMLMQGEHLVPVAADDNHSTLDQFGGWVMIGAESLTYPQVIAAMERGDLYASTGPEIHSLTLDGPLLTVTCSDCVRIQLNSNSRFLMLRTGDHMQAAQFDLSHWFDCPEGYENKAFFRITITDAQNRKAYTRAYWRSELV